MRIIVTGGLGFIGSHFVRKLNRINEDIKILVIDSLTYAADINNLKGCRYDLILKDICDVTEIELGEYDYIVNFAAESHVDNSIKDGRPFIRTNVEGTFNLLELARKNKKLKKFVQISTDEVYGDMEDYNSDTLADESFPLKASSYYSATKASADLLVQSVARTFNLPYLITRTCNNFGSNQHSEKFLPTIISCIKENKPIPVYGDGLNVREWIHADDNANMIYQLMTSSNEGIFNISSGERYTNLEVIELIERILGYQLDLKFIEDRKGHDRRYGLVSSIETPINTNLRMYLSNCFA